MRDPKERQIRQLGLFRGCSTNEVRWIAGVADTIDLAAGSTIVRQGQAAREFVVLVGGVASAVNGSADVTLVPGAYVGDRELIGGGRHGRTITATTPVRVLVFTRGAFKGMLDVVPSVARKLLDDMVTELREVRQAPRSFSAVS